MPDRSLSEQLNQAIDAMLAGSTQTESADPTLSALMAIADRLLDLPDDGFKMRLSDELQNEFERRPPMTASTRIEPAQSSATEFAAVHTVTPFICVPEGARLIEFIKHAFDGEETNRHSHGPDGFVAGLKIGDSDLLVMGGESFRGEECTAALHVYVKDCDATYQRALDAGAFVIGSPGVGEPADRPYGERAAFVSDPFGNYWFIATRMGPNYVPSDLGHVTPCLIPANAAPVIDFLKQAFGAQVEGLHEQAGRMVHAFIRIGEAMLEMSEAEEEKLHRCGLYLHTDDVDAVYYRALAAGAISILPPADQLYGDRLAILEDPAGNRWFAAKRMKL
jgi:PhnB protein